MKRMRFQRREAGLTGRRHWAVVLVVFSALVAVSVGVSGAVAFAGGMSQLGFGPARSALIAPLSQANPAITPAVPNTPTPAPDPNALFNMRQGCAQGKPKPISYVIHGGSYQGKGAAPKEVALTFDDGPSAYSSLPIIQYLEKTHTPATFFVEGQYARLSPNLLRREWLDGFAIGMHSWNHPYMTRVSYSEREHQFGDTYKAIQNVLGKNACLWFWRPPYMDLNTSVFNQAKAHGFTTIDWNDDSRDWSRPGVNSIVNTVLSEVTRGGILLFHDGPALRDQTAAALPRILAGLKARGLKPVTIPQLLADSHYPGVHLTNGVAQAAWQIGNPPAQYMAELLHLRGEGISGGQAITLASTQSNPANDGDTSSSSPDATQPTRQE